ncbi:MAG: hypothetical protein ACFB0A_11640 [Croceivirga sp.]
MTCRTLVSLFLFVLCSNLFAQQQVEKQQWSLDVLLPGVTYEVGLSKKTTLNANLGFGFGLRGDGQNTEYGIYPTGILQYRYYYNFQRRLDKGKRIARNTGNYLSPLVAYTSGEPILGDYQINEGGFVGLAYGLQRTGRKGFQWNFLFGPGIDFEGEFALIINFKLGFVLGKNK